MTNEEKLVVINTYAKIKGYKTGYKLQHEAEAHSLFLAFQFRRFRLINPYWLSKVSVQTVIETIELNEKEGMNESTNT
jgi:hypothetical protein